MRCTRLHCTKDGAFRPVLLLRVHHNHPPAEAMLDLPLCGEHALATTVDDLVNDEGWKAISKQFAFTGHKAPKRELTVVRMDRIME